MPNTNPVELTIAEAAPLLRAHRLSPVDLTRAYLDRIEALNPRVNSFITILRDEAIAGAQVAEREIAGGRYRGPLHGIPYAVKDIFATKGHRTTCGSKILKDAVTDYDATAVTRLAAAGAILIGKLTMSEFAFGDDVNPTTGKGPTRNPWNLERSASGSSSGSGAAVAASMCAAALGTDTGGSIRGPSGFCGIVGMKPTYGRVSRYGVTPLAWSLDNAGPMTKCVEDNAVLLGLLAGPDPKDRMCSERPAGEYLKNLRGGAKGLRIGLPKNYFLEYATRDVGDAVRQAARTLEKQGASVREIDLPHLKYAVGAEIAIIFAEPLAYHQKYIRGGKFDDYTPYNKAQWDAARFISAGDYVQAQRIRRFMVRDFEQAFEQVDVVFAPGMGTEANPIAEDLLTDRVPMRDVPAGTLPLWEVYWRMASPGNLTGVPALVMPCGFSTAGLPFSLQIMGRHFDEATVYRAAAAYEQATDWHTRRPTIAA